MSSVMDPPVQPRNGDTLKVLGVCRSITDHRDVRALADQEALIRRHLAARYDGPIEYLIIRSRACGGMVDREEIREIERLIQTRTIDVVIVEDLSRIARRMYAAVVCELCMDHATRLIAINDHLDTAEKDWRMRVGSSLSRHEIPNCDHPRRIERTLDERFSRQQSDHLSE
jgi:DNA invertase Pin-like site-specific DNA recombinase